MQWTAEDAKRIRKFAITMTIAAGVIALLLLWYQKPKGAVIMGYVAGGFVVLGIPFPMLLWPVERLWMGLAVVLGWINTRILLSVVFYLVVTPVGLAMRLFGRDPLNRRLDPDATSYWNEIDVNAPPVPNHERQF